MIKKMLFLIIICLSAFYTFSQQNHKMLLDSITTEKYSKYDQVVVFDSVKVYVEETGLSHVNTHKLIKILNEKGGKQNNVFIIDYDPLSAFVEFKEIKVHHADGRTTNILDKVYDYVAPARMIYWGASQKMAEIGHLEPGDAIEISFYRKGFTYALLQNENSDNDDSYIPPMRGHFYDIVPFWSDIPVVNKTYIVDIQNSKNLRYKVFNGVIDYNEEKAGDRTKFMFSLKDIMPQKREPSMVAPNDVWTKLLLSTSPNWESKSMWFYNVNEDYGSFVPTEEVKHKVCKLLTGAKSESDSISILTHWVADNMRYSGISMGKGEGYTLHSCNMNYTDRCGVCKDKASLLISMLRAAGFQSYAAMTMAGERIENIPADQFNHSVTVVKHRNGKYELLDPTWVPFVRELWSSAEQQQGYLMGLPDGADLKETPISPASNHYFILQAETSISKKGTLEGELTLTAEGQTDASVRGLLFTRAHHSEWDKNVEKELLRIVPNATIISKTYTTTDNYLLGPVKIKYKFTVPNYAIVTDDEIIFTPLTAKHPFGRALAHLSMSTDIAERQYPFRDRCSRSFEITETIKLPSFQQPAFLPENVSINEQSVHYEGDYRIEGSKIIFTEKGVLDKRIYEPSDWNGFMKTIQAQKIFEQKPVILNRKK